MLNPESPLPLYHQLAQALTAAIRSGTLRPGDRLPSEPELARQHGIGRPTVRQATDVLVRRGLLERRRGSGTYVRSAPAVDIFSLAGTVTAFKSRGIALQTELLEPVSRRRIEEGEPSPLSQRTVYAYVRLGRLDGAPVLVEQVYMDSEVFPNFDSLPYDGASLAELVRERYFLEPTHGEQSFDVRGAPERLQHALELPPTQPVLVVTRTLHFPEAPHALHSRLYCRTDRVTLTQSLGTPT